LIKGIGAASRSVFVFLCLWMIIIYVFAIVFRQITEDSAVGHEFFPSIPDAMNTLMLAGVMPDNTYILNKASSGNALCWPLLCVFVLLAGICVMYMLVGVLVDVVGVIAATEKEGMVVETVAASLRSALDDMDRGTAQPITKYEFTKLLMEKSVVDITQAVGVDIVALVEMTDVIYEDAQNALVGLSFEAFVEVLLNMRGNQPACVKDVKSQIRVIKQIVSNSVADLEVEIKGEIKDLRDLILQLKEAEVAERMEAEAEEAEGEDGEGLGFASDLL